MDADGGVEAFGRMPRPETNASDVFAIGAGGVERDGLSIAEDDVAGICQATNFYLETVERGIDIASGASGAALFTEDVPGFEGLADFEIDAALGYPAVPREAEF